MARDPDKPDLRIDISVEAGAWPPTAELRRIAAEASQAALAVVSRKLLPGSELSLVFTDDASMQALNRQWRGKDKPTNVLSFPACDPDGDTPAGPLLGDIVIALETTTREADLEGKPFSHHLTHLIVHGFIHLFGYDHETDSEAREMEELERRALAKLGIGDPYA
jgi:probable rRNA maturation factor